MTSPSQCIRVVNTHYTSLPRSPIFFIVRRMLTVPLSFLLMNLLHCKKNVDSPFSLFPVSFPITYSSAWAPPAMLLDDSTSGVLLRLLRCNACAQQLEQLDVDCTALIICQSNHRFGVPMFFEDQKWHHNLWQSQLCGSHYWVCQWLLNVCKFVHVGGAGNFLSVHCPITPVVFYHPVTRHTSQKIIRGIFVCLGWSPNVAFVTHSLRLIRCDSMILVLGSM